MTPDVGRCVAAVRSVLSDDLRRKPWRGLPNPIEGHCYLAAEAAFHLLGGATAGWVPVHIAGAEGPHWFLRHQDGRVVDPTADQFESPPAYAQGRGRGFLTLHPSWRAREVARRIVANKGVDRGVRCAAMLMLQPEPKSEPDHAV